MVRGTWLGTVLGSIVTGFVAAVLLIACNGCGDRWSGLRDLPRLPDPAVVRVTMMDSEGPSGLCTAFKVADDLIATAAHCIAESGVTSYALSGPHAVSGSEGFVLYVDRENDVAILRAKVRGDIIRIAAHDPEVGDPVWTSGYPAGKPLASVGFWSGRDTDGQGICSVVVVGGASGSPIIDSDGMAVGVLVAGDLGRSHNMAFVATVEHLRHAVRVANSFNRP